MYFAAVLACVAFVAAHLVKMEVLDREGIKIFDKNNNFGGVWEANKYPGAACDVASHCYAMRFHLDQVILSWSL